MNSSSVTIPKNVSILVVDDEVSIARMISKKLNKNGNICFSAGSAEESLALMAQNLFDVVITDIRMPGMSGVDLLKRIKVEYDSDVIVMTGFTEDYDYESIINAGASDFVYKPVSFRELELRLKRVLRLRYLKIERDEINRKLQENVEQLVKYSGELENAHQELRYAYLDTVNRLETEKQYQLLFNSSDILVYTVNRDGEFLSANPKLYKQHGFADEIQMLGLSVAELCDAEEAEAFISQIETVFETGRSVEYESFDRQCDKWFFHTFSPIKDVEKGEVFAVGGVSKDITERVKKEQELQKAYDILRETREQLIQKDKMASLGRLASGIAHEIRNPMEIILMGVDYLDTRIPEDNTTDRKPIDRIYDAVDRVNTIINDILQFSRKTAFVIEKVKVCPLINDVLSLAGHHLSKNQITVTKNFLDFEIEAAANKNMLEQVMLNIIYNAVDAMAESSAKILAIDIYEETINSTGYKTGYRQTDYFKIGEKMVVIEIADTGKGMDEAVARKIFEPFFTTKEIGKGTGLGLSLAHMIIDRMKGTIDVESRPGKGTAFFVKLQPASNMDNLIKDEINGIENEGIDC